MPLFIQTKGAVNDKLGGTYVPAREGNERAYILDKTKKTEKFGTCSHVSKQMPYFGHTAVTAGY